MAIFAPLLTLCERGRLAFVRRDEDFVSEPFAAFERWRQVMRRIGALAVAVGLFATPASAHEFLDYFAYGRTELSPAGNQMVRSVVTYVRDKHPSRILIVAHMDTAEATEFSDELSRRRAQMVASELAILGINPAVIELQGRGATQLARPTPPNTAEPLNRRVIVYINF